MSDHSAENSAAIKRIKQLENQNIKFKNLLKTALDISHQDISDAGAINDEARSLKETIDILEKQKSELDNELQSVLEDSDSEIMHTVRKLEMENLDLKKKFEEVLKDIKMGTSEIEDLKAEDIELKQILADLESEKLKLLGEIKRVEKTGGSLSDESIKLHERLSALENKKSSMIKSLHDKELPELSSIDMLSNFKSLEKTYKDYVDALQEQSSLKEKVSELEEKNEELLKVVQKAESEDMRLQLKLRESIIRSNTNLLVKITEVKSKLKSNLVLNEDFVKSVETPRELDIKISQLENEKRALYNDLEQTLEKSTRDISKISENLSDPEIKRLVNEIEIQKTVLLYNLRTIKLNEQKPVYSDYNFLLPNLPESKSNPLPDPDVSKPGISNSKESRHASEGKSDGKSVDQTASKDGRQKLAKEVARLEYEREMMLKRLHSMSTTSAQRFERNLQRAPVAHAQSELHGDLVLESSHEILTSHDNATNQLYVDEETKMEHRIRELELENARIQVELDGILGEIKKDKPEMSAVQSTGKVLRGRTDKVENKSQEFKRI